MDAKAIVERFWQIQDEGDYTALVDLFAEDALLEDPVYGNFEGREAIRGFMEKMNVEMKDRDIDFVANLIAGEGSVAWCQWTARTPTEDIEGCGLYRTRNGQLIYYKDYMNAQSSG
ncbi:MAG: nuclear transport factor 2 family protein [Halieaceae bacterium]|nr:nuclear transport factor 2 family protein [Halieaceae bacterium]